MLLISWKREINRWHQFCKTDLLHWPWPGLLWGNYIPWKNLYDARVNSMRQQSEEGQMRKGEGVEGAAVGSDGWWKSTLVVLFRPNWKLFTKNVIQEYTVLIQGKVYCSLRYAWRMTIRELCARPYSSNAGYFRFQEWAAFIPHGTYKCSYSYWTRKSVTFASDFGCVWLNGNGSLDESVSSTDWNKYGEPRHPIVVDRLPKETQQSSLRADLKPRFSANYISLESDI